MLPDEDFRKEMEPGAAPMKDRISALEALSKQGCYTWISIEPYPTPNIHEQNLEQLLERVSFVRGYGTGLRQALPHKDRD